MAGIHDEAVAIASELTELRRAIHADPEIGLDLPRTQRKVLDALDGLPLDITLGTGLGAASTYDSLIAFGQLSSVVNGVIT